MIAWFNAYLEMLVMLVNKVFSLDLGIGFSLGDIEIALMIIGIVASALVLKVQSGINDIPIERSNNFVSKGQYANTKK